MLNKELTAVTSHILDKNSALNELSEYVSDIASQMNPELRKELVHLKHKISSNINLDDDWEKFRLHFSKVNPGFFETLEEKCPDLTDLEKKHCAFASLKLNNKDVAKLLNIEPASVKMARYRIRKKFSSSTEDLLLRQLTGI
ncbi:MAG: hypothetical protein R3B47_05675 [Bacteroidia bacterium]